jgi:hypothetical protein
MDLRSKLATPFNSRQKSTPDALEIIPNIDKIKERKKPMVNSH